MVDTMKTYFSLDDGARSPQAHNKAPTSVALGMFDGVHLGHQQVLSKALHQSDPRYLLHSVVFTFSNHPQELISKKTPPMLTTVEERLRCFEMMGFESTLMLPFTEELMQCSADSFVKDILVDALHTNYIATGYNFCYGHQRQGNTQELKIAGKKHGFQTRIIDPVSLSLQTDPDNDTKEPVVISSTAIRNYLQSGDMKPATQLLGRPFRLTGKVVKGEQRGRTLGFPTANLGLEARQLVPKNGVYVGIASMEKTIQSKKEVFKYNAVCNVGHAPTFDGGTPQPRVEVHLLGYKGNDFYGSKLSFNFMERLRDEQPFDSPDELKAHIKQDCEQAAIIMAKLNPPKPPTPPTHHTDSNTGNKPPMGVNRNTGAGRPPIRGAGSKPPMNTAPRRPLDKPAGRPVADRSANKPATKSVDRPVRRTGMKAPIRPLPKKPNTASSTQPKASSDTNNDE